MKEIELEKISDVSDELWELLSEKEKLLLFVAVVRRIYQGELIECRSYRGILYDIFNFGPESYHIAQQSGFLDLHNSIFNKQYLITLFSELLLKNNFTLSDEDIDFFLTEKNIK
jgi:hypothetical protein